MAGGTPPFPQKRVAYALVPLLLTAFAACSGSKHAGAPTSTSRSTARACRAVPTPLPANATTSWLPVDLPLPPGTQPVSLDAAAADGSRHGVFATPGTIRDFVRFALTQWPAHGWRLGRGDSEANEAEDEFVRGNAGGSFKVRSDYCDTNWSELNLFYKPGLP